MTASMRLK
uniref:Probable msrA leader peptide n=2 Tax=Staphylococcus TaxID=1279 RepID=LPMS_STAEP|nr:RecName: Full=Probable msrA leader peptide [Staphylococcus epidermidis]BAA34538.1 leader peptide [Staphylococcus aureus]CAA36303.1 unnamed protein product [Staphylococcus epidermidis]